MTLADSLDILQKNSEGYCLWVGAGTTVHLAGLTHVPLWSQLVTNLQSEASLPSLAGEYPDRLKRLLEAFGRPAFQRRLRQNVLDGCSHGILSLAEIFTGDDPVPPQVRQIAHLGMQANPIVNFNIEAVTSTLLAKPAGPYAVKYFEPPVPDAVRGFIVHTGMSQGRRYRRQVLHPHGVIDHSGICVMTRDEYDSMSGTLAFQLATHAAFRNRLAIVGMSLEDEYLRAQLSGFREQISDIFWFVDSAPQDATIQTWAKQNRITIVIIGSWSEFWTRVSAVLPAPDELQLLHTWHGLVESAYYNLSTSPVSRWIATLSEPPDDLLRFRDSLGETYPRAPNEHATLEEERLALAPINAAIRRLTDTSPE